jgi:hypothetical protein
VERSVAIATLPLGPEIPAFDPADRLEIGLLAREANGGSGWSMGV